MNAGPRRVTQKDIARAAGTDQSTVSLALRHHPRIPSKTREHILSVAKDLGYRPDPLLTALADYRFQRRVPDFRGTLGWLADSRQGELWRQNRHISGFYRAGLRQAESLGYKLDVFDLADLQASWSRVGAIARSRGVQGLLVCSQPEAQRRIDHFPWSDFAAVTFGHTLAAPRLDAVSSNHLESIVEIMSQLYHRGYRRVGLALRPEHDQRIGYGYSAGYLSFLHRRNLAQPVPICPDDGHGTDGAVLLSWLKDYKPDALIACGNLYIRETLTAWGYRIPADLGVAAPIVDTSDPTFSGIYEDTEEIGRVAVDLVVAMIQRGYTGLPDKPKRHLVNGLWQAGQSLRPLNSSSESPSHPGRFLSCG